MCMRGSYGTLCSETDEVAGPAAVEVPRDPPPVRAFPLHHAGMEVPPNSFTPPPFLPLQAST